MESVYIDVHIHTSENPDCLNENYDVDTLFSKIRHASQGQQSLISLTDHNTINKKVYLEALKKCGSDIHLLLGVELHIHYVKETEAYHCHMLFKNAISEHVIDEVNAILNKLYVKKQVEKKDVNIPTLDKIINEFDSYDFMLLPHGGQSHATFNTAIPEGKKFDTMMERSIYYNQFDGFTARSDSGREETDKYFNRLGISDFVNLVTCSDNYNPSCYPDAKAKNAEPYIPTWMFAAPTFDGLRLSLSEKSRLVYSQNKPDSWSENIESVKYANDKLDIDVKLSSGLNVIIGGSSSGKTLLVDSLWRKLANKDFENSYYKDFGVENLNVINPSGIQPHYLSQNYIMKVVGDDEQHNIEDIDIIRSLFPDNKDVVNQINSSLSKLKNDITQLIQTVEDIQSIENKLNATLQIGHLLVLKAVKQNIIVPFKPQDESRLTIKYDKDKMNTHIETLCEIKTLLDNNPFVKPQNETIEVLINLLKTIYRYSEMESSVYQEIITAYNNYAALLRTESQEEQTKTQEFNKLLSNITQYIFLNRKFKKILNTIAAYNVKFVTKEIVSSEHHLYINNQFKMDKDVVLSVFNSLLKTGGKINSFGEICPQKLYESNFSKQKPKVQNYKDFIDRVYNEFVQKNKTTYKITTSDGRDFDNLSAGWKTSVLLDLILGYDQDIAPIIIDQPEDNLATKYINDGLVKAIKKVKKNKQIILVSHNATIPMMGDAQRIIYCENTDGKIVIRSAPLEGEIDGKPVLDLIASITDGGKSSIKKRVKKYNLKKYTE